MTTEKYALRTMSGKYLQGQLRSGGRFESAIMSFFFRGHSMYYWRIQEVELGSATLFDSTTGPDILLMKNSLEQFNVSKDVQIVKVVRSNIKIEKDRVFCFRYGEQFLTFIWGHKDETADVYLTNDYRKASTIVKYDEKQFDEKANHYLKLANFAGYSGSKLKLIPIDSFTKEFV